MAGLDERQGRGGAGQNGLLRGRSRTLREVGFSVEEWSSEDRGGPHHVRMDSGGDREGKGGSFSGTDLACRNLPDLTLNSIATLEKIDL